MKTIKMKRCRNQYRNRKNKLIEKMKIFRLNKTTLKKKILNFINKQSRRANFIDDFDQKNTRKKFKRQNREREKNFIELLFKNLLRKSIVFFQKRIFDHFYESTFLQKYSLIFHIQHEHKIKYQNIFNFYENHNE